MEPRFEDRAAFRVVGALAHGRQEEMDFEVLWREEFMPHHARLQPLSTDGVYYGVCTDAGEPGVIDYLAGMAVGGDVAVPEGLVARDIGPARDAVFECTVGTISSTWGRIFGEWLPRSGYEYDGASACYEHYPPATSGKDSPVFIHVPVRGAGSA